MIFFPVLTGAVGIIVSAILVGCSILIPRWFVSEAVHQLDVIRFNGRIFSKKESMAVGILVHMIFSFFFGAVFGAGVYMGIVSIDVVSMLVLFLCISLVFGGILLPLEGHGFFGWKEDHWISVDLLAMNAVWILMFWALLAALT